MRYNEQINIKLYKYENSTFVLQAIIDDYQEISFAHNLYESGDFTITINYNIPNALKFERGMFVQFGNDSYMFGEILTINDAIGQDGKGSQIRTITGKDSRYLFKRRIIKNLNNVENWAMTAKGEICLRELIKSQCGIGAEAKRQLPIINTIPASADAIGKEYSVAESFSNLYDTLVTIATQSEIGWRIKFDGTLTLEVYEGSDLSAQVQFSTDFDSLSNGQFSDSAESYANTIYVGGKGTGSDRDIYEGESAIEGESPSGLDRFEAWDNQSGMTSESEYEAEALSMLTQYGQTINVSGNGLAQCPYIFKENYDVGDVITLAFSGKSAKAQILSVTEHWTWGQYGIEFSFGKPQNDLSRQLQLILKQIQKASNKTTTTSSVRYYEIPTDTSQPKADVIYDTIGFTGTVGSGATFTLYWDSEKTGAKTYHVYFKQLGGTGKLTLTTGVSGKQNLVLNAGTYVAIIYVDGEGNVSSEGATATSAIQTGNNQPATSGGVADAIQDVVDVSSSLPTDAILHYSFDDIPDYPDGTAVYKRNNDFTSEDDWRGNATTNYNNGVLELSSQSGAKYAYKLLSFSNCIVKLCITANINTNVALYATGSTSSDFNILLKANQKTEVVYYFAGSATAIGVTNIKEGVTISVEAIYIGNGSYSTPIIDNANGQNNATNNGGIAVKGVSGKGVLGFKSHDLANIGAFNFTDNFSVSIWVNPANNTVNLDGDILFKDSCFVLRNGFNDSTNRLMIVIWNTNTNAWNIVYLLNTILSANQWQHLVVTKNGTTIKFYLNGVLKSTQTLSFNVMGQNTNNLVMHRGTQYARETSYDDLLIFDRALTADEVTALYLNKANTPKYYNINNYNLKQIKDITAQSSDFADFQSRMAGLATRNLQVIEPTEDER